MPLRNDLLNPISAENPAGQNLRYDPIYDRIREARREDDDAPQGDWKYERKAADWPVAIKLMSDAIATRSKDLQLAAWLTDAMLRREGIPGLREGLDLLRGLVESFWDGLYPELEDGDAEFRAAPLQWVGDRLEMPVKRVPLTNGKLDWLVYRESRAVGTGEQADTPEKVDKRHLAIAEGKTPPEVFDKDFNETPKAFYAALEQAYDGALESLAQLSTVCDEKFGEASPSFRTLRVTLEEVRQTVHTLLLEKRKKEPDAAPEASQSAAEEPAVVTDAVAAAAAVAGPAAAVAAAPALRAGLGSYDDAVAHIVAAAKFLRQQDPYNPAPYLMLRGLRWGELRAAGATIDQSKLAAPPSAIRQALKRQAMEGNWTEVLETAETAMGMECGCGWLDVQRYVGRACSELGSCYEPIRDAVISGVRGLLADYPQLLEVTMADDTPTANLETQAWLKEQANGGGGAQMEPGYGYAEPEPGEETQAGAPAAQAPDPFYLAMQAARNGRAQDGIDLLMREMMQEPSGRGRFQRKVQVAQLCLATGNDTIAFPILQEAVGEIERRKLEEWEAREVVAHPLAMLYRCLVKCDGSSSERQKLYALICRLDPLAAMDLSR